MLSLSCVVHPLCKVFSPQDNATTSLYAGTVQNLRRHAGQLNLQTLNHRHPEISLFWRPPHFGLRRRMRNAHNHRQVTNVSRSASYSLSVRMLHSIDNSA